MADLQLALQAGLWGTIWAVALVVWGLGATLVAVTALLRSPFIGDAGRLGRLHALIRRSGLARSAPVASVAHAVVADPARDPRAQEQPPVRRGGRRWWPGRRQRQAAALAVKQAVA